VDHREYHHEQSARDYAGRSQPEAQLGPNTKGGGRGKGGDKGKPKSGGAQRGAAATEARKGVCFEMAREGKCTRSNCEYSHEEKDLAEYRRKQKEKSKSDSSGKGGGRKGQGKGRGRGSGGGRGRGGLAAGGSSVDELRPLGDGSALRAYAGLNGDVVRIAAQGRSVPQKGRLGSLAELGDDVFEKAANRPPGYTAQSRVFLGGALCMPVLFDTGSSCGGIREEEALEIVRFCQGGLESGSLKLSSPSYPIKRIEIVKAPEQLIGLAAGAEVRIIHTMVLRLEFRPAAGESGPIRDVVLKVFPKGTSTFPGIILGHPILAVVPHGLGFRICQ